MKTNHFFPAVLMAAALGLASLACSQPESQTSAGATPTVSAAEATATATLTAAVTATATAQPPAATATTTGATTAAAPTPTALANLANTLVIDQQDSGRSFEVNPGQTLAISLDTNQTWNLQLSDASVLTPDSGRLGAGVVAVYRAARSGQTTITATGAVKCPPGAVCPAIATIVSFTIIVK